MSKILVIEPHKILQQAIALALFPRHETRIVATIPGGETLDGIDAVIMDAGALREAGVFSEQAIRSLQQRKVPTVWIESGAATTACGDKTVVIQKPIVKETLQKSLATCLGEADGPSKSGASRSAERAVSAAGGPATEQAGGGVIELVDVVEDTSRPTKEKSTKS